MKTLGKPLLARVAATLALVTCALAAPTAHAFQADGTIIICSIEPLTGIGTAFGAPNYNGKMIAIEEVNNAGGVEIDGKKVKIRLISDDDQAKPDQGVALFRKCAESDKALVISGTCRT